MDVKEFFTWHMIARNNQEAKWESLSSHYKEEWGHAYDFWNLKGRPELDVSGKGYFGTSEYKVYVAKIKQNNGQVFFNPPKPKIPERILNH